MEAYPDQHDVAYSLVLLRAGSSRSNEAPEYLAQASHGMPQRPRMHFNYGWPLAQMGRDAEAAAALRKAPDLEPQSIDYLFALIDFYYEHGQFDEALVLADRMIEAHPQQRFGYDIKADIEGR